MDGIMVAPGVSGIASVLHPGGASSLHAHSVIGTMLSPLCLVSMLSMRSRISSVFNVMSGWSSSLSSLSAWSVRVS